MTFTLIVFWVFPFELCTCIVKHTEILRDPVSNNMYQMLNDHYHCSCICTNSKNIPLFLSAAFSKYRTQGVCESCLLMMFSYLLADFKAGPRLELLSTNIENAAHE